MLAFFIEKRIQSITMKSFNRRDVLGMGLSIGAMTKTGFAVEKPYSRNGKGKLLPALAAYSFRSHFGYTKGKANKNISPEEALDMKRFIHICAENGVAAELTSYFFPPEVEDSFLVDCRKEAHLNGVPIAGTAVGNQFTLDPASDEAIAQMNYVKRWIDGAVLMGAPHIRVFMGRIPKGMPEPAAEKNAIVALAQAGEYAAERGIFLGIENHDSIGSAERLLHIVKSVKNPWVGVNLDSGNFRTEDPYHDFAESVPFSVNVQLKTHLKIGGEKVPTDLEKVFQLLRKGNYSGYVVLEYEEKEDPFTRVPAILKDLKRHCHA